MAETKWLHDELLVTSENSETTFSISALWNLKHVKEVLGIWAGRGHTCAGARHWGVSEEVKGSHVAGAAAEQDEVGRRQEAEQARLSELVGNLDFTEKLLEDVVQHTF